MNTLEKTIIIIVVSTILLSSIHFGQGYAKSKDSKAKDAIIKALGKAVEGKYSKIDLMSVSKFNDSSSVFFYNKTKGPSPPIPIPCATGSIVVNGKCIPQSCPPNCPPAPCPTGTHEDSNGRCVPNVIPPTPAADATTVCLAGDLSGSSVPNSMKDCNLKIGLGDLGYQSDLSYFKGLNFNKCVIGNHDSIEDGTSSIQTEALTYCGDHWSLKTANGTTLIIGLNTNGDQQTQLSFYKTAISNLAGIKNVIAVSHKNGNVFPNAHHPAEAKSLYSSIEQITTGVKLFEISGHNHNLAQGGNWFIAGGGGRSHYSCGTDAVWTFCDNSNFGYLKLTVDNKNGNITTGFYDTSNKKLN